ncbi:MAG: exonuclease SbcCD subunit D [Candidatus Bathyarchaeia archaeon]
MARFAHLADVHLGSWRETKLRELNFQSFAKAIDECVERNINFLLVSGDLFDHTHPDFQIVKRAIEKLAELRKTGAPIYFAPGSHDFAPNTTSMTDILASSGVITKVGDGEFENDRLRPHFVIDFDTGAKIAAIPGRRLALERAYFEMLDREYLEKEDGFKIFAFHSAIKEAKPGSVSYPDSIPLSLLPRGFDYYAGGHVHEQIKLEIDEYGTIAYPGPIFGATFTDLEIATGYNRGFFVVEFDDRIKSVERVQVEQAEIVYKEVEVGTKSSKQTEEELRQIAKELDARGKLVLLKVRGMLSLGKPSDINFGEIRQLILEKQPASISINHHQLKAQELTDIKLRTQPREQIEENILTEHMTRFKLDPTTDSKLREKLEERLTSHTGIKLAKSLLHALNTEQKEGEAKSDFQFRVLQSARNLLDLEAQE